MPTVSLHNYLSLCSVLMTEFLEMSRLRIPYQQQLFCCMTKDIIKLVNKACFLIIYYTFPVLYFK